MPGCSLGPELQGPEWTIQNFLHVNRGKRARMEHEVLMQVVESSLAAQLKLIARAQGFSPGCLKGTSRQTALHSYAFTYLSNWQMLSRLKGNYPGSWQWINICDSSLEANSPVNSSYSLSPSERTLVRNIDISYYIVEIQGTLFAKSLFSRSRSK